MNNLNNSTKRKEKRALSRRTCAILISVVMLISLIPVFQTIAASGLTGLIGEVPVNEKYFTIDDGIDNPQSTTPAALELGAVWTRKSVAYDGAGKFTITLEAWGNPYSNGSLLEQGTVVRVEDTIGSQFSVVKPLPAGFTESGDIVTYEFTESAISGGSPASASFELTLKKGWTIGPWYYTNSAAVIYFTPSRDNGYFWTNVEIIEDGFEILKSGFSWNDGNLLNEITIKDDVLGTFKLERDKNSLINGITYTPAGRNVSPYNSNSSLNAAMRGKWGYYASPSNSPGAIKDYFFWFMTASGDLYEYEADVSNPGGNTGREGRIIITTDQPHQKRHHDWDNSGSGGGRIKTALQTTGKLRIDYNNTYTVQIKYSANDNDGGSKADPGTIPVDNERYIEGDTADLKSQTPTRRGYVFVKWNTKPDGSGNDYNPGGTISIDDDSDDIYLYAQWEALPEFVILYDANVTGSSQPTPPADAGNPYYEGESITILGQGSMTRPGYKFIGWTSEPDGSGIKYSPPGSLYGSSSYYVPSVPAEGGSVTLYAQWEAFYTVKYDRNTGATGTPPSDTTQYKAGDEVTVKAKGNISRTNYVFIGWNTSADGSGIPFDPNDTFAIPDDVAIADDNSVTLYAQWSQAYTVTYNRNGGTGTAPTDRNSPYMKDADVTVLGRNNMTRTNYTFKGWSTTPNGAVEYSEGDAFTMPGSNVVLYAVWEPLNSYRVYYNANGGTGTQVDTGSYYGDSRVTIKNRGTMSFEGSNFVGWNTKPDGSGTWYQANDRMIMPYSDVTLYAQWNDYAHRVNYDKGDVEVTGSEPEDDNFYIKDAKVTVKGKGNMTHPTKTFVGWRDRDGNWYYPGDTLIMPDDDLVLIAQWSDDDTYKVRYHGNGNTGGTEPVDGNDYLDEAKITVKDQNTLAKPGWRFVGWSKSPGGPVEYLPGDKITIDGNNVDLYAQWESEDAYTVTYNPNGGRGNPPIDSNVYGPGDSATVKGKGDIGRIGHTFIGWNTNRNGTGDWYDVNDRLTMPDADVILYAQWDTRILFRVIYDANGGSGAPIDGTFYEPDSDVNIIFNPPPTRSGYTFLGWSTNENATVPEYRRSGTISFVITDDTTLYAVWSRNTGGEDNGTIPESENETDTESQNVGGSEEPGPSPGDKDGTGDIEDIGNLPSQIVFPDDEGPENFPEIDFNKKQPDPTTPGGTDSNAPPVPNDSEHRLMPQYNDDGDIVFIELDFEDVPLGMWSYDSDDGMWLFDEYLPLGGLPQTGYFNSLPWFMLIGVTVLCIGIGINIRYVAKRKEG